MSGMWKRSQGCASETPPDEGGGYRYAQPTATAPHLDSTQPLRGAEVCASGPAIPSFDLKPINFLAGIIKCADRQSTICNAAPSRGLCELIFPFSLDSPDEMAFGQPRAPIPD